MPPPSFLLRAAAAAASAAVACAWGEQIEHIIVFMQENRAYDHYYGTHQGVRGFNDRAAIPLRSGLDSLYQPVDQNDLTKYQLPFHTSTMSTSSICMPAPAMDYVHDMLIINEGRFDSWNTGRPAGMGQAFFNRSDLPYYYQVRFNDARARLAPHGARPLPCPLGPLFSWRARSPAPPHPTHALACPLGPLVAALRVLRCG